MAASWAPHGSGEREPMNFGKHWDVCAKRSNEGPEAKDGSFWKNTSPWEEFLRFPNKGGWAQGHVLGLGTARQRSGARWLARLSGVRTRDGD